jgi:NAD(P)-dependent dehydrogenase (short-subunit alcohol dehydrogenase family)
LTVGRLLVVGASSGIGRAVALAAQAAGSPVVGAARRVAAIEAAGVPALACDVRDPTACRQVVVAAIETLGGLDHLVFAAGVAPLVPLADTDAAAWQDVLQTNVIGAALVTAAAVSSGSLRSACYLGSSSVPSPWPGLGAYAASKAALTTLAAAWRAECPQVRFTCLAVTPTLSSFADGWDPEQAAEALRRWAAAGYLAGEVSTVEDMAKQVLATL